MIFGRSQKFAPAGLKYIKEQSDCREDVYEVWFGKLIVKVLTLLPDCPGVRAERGTVNQFLKLLSVMTP